MTPRRFEISETAEILLSQYWNRPRRNGPTFCRYWSGQSRRESSTLSPDFQTADG